MALGPNKRFSLNTGSQAERMTGAQAHAAGIDAGLRAYMLKVYNYMASGVFITGIVSLFLFKFEYLNAYPSTAVLLKGGTFNFETMSLDKILPNA